jgi:membrane associated rhomboid family serine protease
MLPIGDRNPTRTTPFVTYALLVANVAVFVVQAVLTQQGGDAWLVPGYGLVPSRVLTDPAGEAFTILTSQFMHGGLMHLVGNMLFLHIFGDNVEDAIGHGRYILFYLVSGVAAGLAQILTDTTSMIPMVGASGAIAGVLGAYLVLYPSAPITVLVPPPLGFLVGLFVVWPAWLVMGLWFVYNLLSGLGSLAGAGDGGVAFFAHIGGFLAGLLLIRPLHTGRERVPIDRFRGFRPPPKKLPASRL